MNQLRYIVLVVLVVSAAMAAVLWQNQERDTPTITFTRPVPETPNDESADKSVNENAESTSMVPLTEPLSSSGELVDNEITTPPVSAVEAPLSEAELAVKIKQAQEKLARVEALNARKQALVERELAQQGDAGQSLLEAELAYRIGGWRQAWRTGDVQRYFDYYSGDFVPDNGASLEQWKAQRVKRLNPEKPISLELEDFKVEYDAQTQRSLVRFKQVYQSGDYQDEVRKRLVMAKEQGQWKIVAETAE